MSIATKTERRLLTQSEAEIVEPTHYPAICSIPGDELEARRRLLRGYRDKARDVASQQRREMRGKGKARGAVSARDNTGTRMKQQIFAQALKRVNKEIARRVKVTAQPTPFLGEIRGNFSTEIA